MAMTELCCVDCGEVRNAMKAVSKHGVQYWLSSCKTCIRENQRVLKVLKKDHPMPPSGTPCQLCGRIDILFCDHDHVTKEFRGFVCRKCNSGIGALGDCEAGVAKALAYLQKTRSSERSRSPALKKDDDTSESDQVASCGSND